MWLRINYSNKILNRKLRTLMLIKGTITSGSCPQRSWLSPRKLQALISDILLSTIAVFSYAIGSRKLSANEQFFVDAQTVVSLLQTTQTKQGVSFTAASKFFTCTNKTTIV